MLIVRSFSHSTPSIASSEIGMPAAIQNATRALRNRNSTRQHQQQPAQAVAQQKVDAVADQLGGIVEDLDPQVRRRGRAQGREIVVDGVREHQRIVGHRALDVKLIAGIALPAARPAARGRSRRSPGRCRPRSACGPRWWPGPRSRRSPRRCGPGPGRAAGARTRRPGRRRADPATIARSHRRRRPGSGRGAAGLSGSTSTRISSSRLPKNVMRSTPSASRSSRICLAIRLSAGSL